MMSKTSATADRKDVLHICKAAAPGVAIALTVAAAAAFVSSTYGGPTMLLALLLGLALNFVSEAPKCAPGITFTSKTLLKVGVALLGFRITLDDVISLGPQTAAIIVACVTATIFCGIMLGKTLSNSSRFGVLIGGATAICGASAALAISSVLPGGKQAERDTAFAVVAVASLSTLAMIIYPSLFAAMGFDEHRIGILIGLTIHDVAQVVGAAYSVSVDAGETATIVKLFRVALLLPVVLIVSAMFAARMGGDTKKPPLVPMFAVAFTVFAGINSLDLIPASVHAVIDGVARALLVAAVAAVGLSTSLRDMTTLGPRPAVAAMVTTLILFALASGLVGLFA